MQNATHRNTPLSILSLKTKIKSIQFLTFLKINQNRKPFIPLNLTLRPPPSPPPPPPLSMSSRGFGFPISDDDASHSLSPESFYLSSFHHQKPLHHKNQTLEDAFTRLSISTSAFNPPLPDHAFDASFSRHAFHPPNLSQTGFSQTGFNANAGGDESLLPSGFLDSVAPLLRQSSGFSNGGGGGDLLGGIGEIPGMNLNECWRGSVLSFAKDQYGCRILQERMKRMAAEDFSFIFLELIDHVTELMVDPFGNYVFQKMVEICSDEQRTHIVLVVTRPNFLLVRVCLKPHGTRSVERLLESVTNDEQRDLIMAALSPGAVVLAKDTNGHRVVLYCLKHFSGEATKYLLNEVANNSFGIAKDKTGCCVLQQCILHAMGETKMRLIADVIVNASLLAEDCYGNYVVQHLLSLKIPVVTENLLIQLQGKFSYLACNKYGSNVVEKFFQESGEMHSMRIVLELLHDPNVARLLVDPYGNYVIKTALMISKGAIRNALLQLIQINSTMMRNNLYGKKLLDRFDRGKIRHI